MTVIHSRDTVDARLSARARAFLNRLRRQLRGDADPAYAMVILDADGTEYRAEILTHGNRSDLVFAAAILLKEAVDLEARPDGPCLCPHCDERTAAARQALAALGFTLPGAVN